MAPGYACPVCDVHEADAVHLANHLAVTASLGREDHLAWLEEHAPDWADCGPEELAERVADDAQTVETPSGPTAGDGHDRDRGRPGFERDLARQTRQPGRGRLGGAAETDQILDEARDLTRRMYEGGAAAGEAERDRATTRGDERPGEPEKGREDADADASENG